VSASIEAMRASKSASVALVTESRDERCMNTDVKTRIFMVSIFRNFLNLRLTIAQKLL
jgi:hypothetical protein